MLTNEVFFRLLRRAGPVLVLSVMLIGITLLATNRATTASPLLELAAPETAGLQLDVQGPDTTRADREITFTLFITNNSGQVLPNVVLTDTWYPSMTHLYNGNFQINGLSLITHSFQPTAAQPYIRWDFGTLAPGASGSIIITTYVTATLQPSTTKNTIGTPTILANTAALATSAPGVASVNDGVNPLVIGPVMYLEKFYTPTLQRPGRLVTFTLKLTNRSVTERADSISSTNTLITEVIPAKTILWSVLPQAGVSYQFVDSLQLLTYSLASPVNPGQSVYLTFTVRLTPTLKNTSDVNSIRNNRAAFGFRSTEVTIPRIGDADVALTGNDVVEKSVQVGPPPPAVGNPPRTFPNRYITYTIAVYNPFTDTLSGFRITDTLPQSSAGGPYFIYSDTLAVPPFSAPTVYSVSGRTVAWDLPNIDGWGVYSFSFRVLVPPNFDTSTGGRTVDNVVYGLKLPNPLVIYDNLGPQEAKVTVVPQLVPVKSISPGPVFSGYPETYTLWLTNTGNTTITNLIVTDTLPSDGVNRWSYDSMIFGPVPVTVTANPPQVIWQGLTVPPYGGVRLTFRVIAIGVPPPSGGNYCNTVGGYSPDTFIPTVSNLACMQFLNPFRINKTAIAPNGYVVLGGAYAYSITIFNVSLQNYAVTQLYDNLPYGFHVLNGGGLYTLNYDPPAAFPASGQLSTMFDVIAESVPQDICNRLPTSIEQGGGRVGFTLEEPPQTWVNAGNLGPVTVHPHITLINWSELPGAAPGEPVTYTVVLTNNTSNNYTNLILTDTLPVGFQFASMAPGSVVPPPQVNGSVLVWTGLVLPPDGALHFTFVATASQQAGDNLENDIAVTDLSNLNTCIPWLGTGANAKAGVRINVRLKKLEYTKTATPNSVGPLGLVQYAVGVKNNGPYPVYNVVVTDVLPTSIAEPYWQFNANVSLPAGVTQVSTNPPAWRIAQINNGSTANFSFKARASIFPGANYKNYMEGWAAYWTFGPQASPPYNGAPVTIVPGAALDKLVSPKTALAGERVVYTITLYNQSGSALTNLRITDTLPTGFTYDGMLSPANPSPDTISPLVWGTKLPASLANNSRLELVFYARVSITLASGTYYNRVAAAAANILIPSTDETAPVKVLGAPNVSSSKIAYPSSTYRGGTTAYTITLTNEGDDPLTVLVTDTLPTGLSFVAPLGETPLPDTVSPLVWSNIALLGGESRQLGFVAYVATDALTGTRYNQVDVSSGALRFAGTGPTAPIYVAPQPEYDLQVTKAGEPPLVALGERITYTISYHNASDDNVNLSNVTLNDMFPSSGVTYVDGSGWSETAPGVRTLNVGALAANASGVVTLVLQIDPSFVGEYLQNHVTIAGTPSVNAVETNLSNDAADAITFVGAPPNVTIAKIANPTLVFAGEGLVYTLTLTNQSSAPLTLRITDTMPAGFVFSHTIGVTPQPISTSPLVWQNVSLLAGQSIDLVWAAGVATNVLPGFYTNDVALDANGLALPGALGLAQVETDIRRYYDLIVTKTDNQTQAIPGSIVTYTLRYTNTSNNVTLSQVTLTDIYSPNDYLTFLGSGWTAVSAGVYSRTLPDLAPGASDSLLVPIQISAGLPGAFLSITNTVNIGATPTQRAADTNAANNASTDIDIVHGPDVVVTSMTYAPARLRQYGPITVTVVYKNQGLDPTLGSDGKGWFGTDLYLKPAGSPPPSGPADHADGLCPTPTGACKYVKAFNGAGLAANEVFTVTYSFVLPIGGAQRLYVQADPYWNVPGSGTLYGTAQNGRLVEGDELNNIYGPIDIFAQPAVYLPLIRRN